jgi:putative lysine transport system substrate-binding protein
MKLSKVALLGCALSLLGGVGLTSCSSSSEGDTLVVGLECNYSPFNWTEDASNEYTLPINGTNKYADGYDIQMAKKLGEDIGYKVVIKQIVWDSLVPSLNSGLINCIIAGMSYSEERDKSIDFTDNYYQSQMCVVVKKGSGLEDISDIQELSGKKVVSQISTLTDSIIDQINGVTHQNPLDTFGLCALAVSSGVFDAMTAEYPVASVIAANNSNLAVVTFAEDKGFQGLDKNELGVAIGIKEGNSDLQSKLNASLAKISTSERTSMMDAVSLRAKGDN